MPSTKTPRPASTKPARKGRASAKKAAPEPLRGGVQQLPSGRWRLRFTTPDKQRRSATFDTEREALVALTVAGETYKPDAPMTLGEWGEKWLDARELSGEHRAVWNERSVWKTHVEGTDLAELPLKAVTRREVKAWLDALKTKKARAPWKANQTGPVYRAKTLSRGVVRLALSLVRCALAAAVDEDLVEENVAREVKVGMKTASTSEGFDYLRADEIAKVLTCAAVPSWARVILTVAIYTGMRQGELWGLHWPDVVLEGDRPEVIVRHSHKGPTKSGKVRRVPLLAPAREALEQWKKIATPNVDGLVFPTVTGLRRPRSNDAGWSRGPQIRGPRPKGTPSHKPGWRELAGVTRRVKFHDLRHTCASHLLMGTWGRAWALSEVRDWLGHTAIKQTEVYAHLSPEHLHHAAQATPASLPVGDTNGDTPRENPSEHERLDQTSCMMGSRLRM